MLVTMARMTMETVSLVAREEALGKRSGAMFSVRAP